MIDFRYHIVSIVAVLIALSIGIVLGTGTLGGPLLDDLENNLDELRTELRDRRAENADLESQIAIQEDFSSSSEPYILRESLQGQDVIIIEFQGTPGELADRLRSSVALAGGSTSTTIEIRDKFALDGDIETEELALSISSVSGDPEGLRSEAAGLIGDSLGSAAAGRVGSGSAALLEDLQAADFVDVEQTTEEVPPIAEGAIFLIVAGSSDDPPFPVAPFVMDMARGMTTEGAVLMAAEPLESAWEVVSSIRNDSDARDEIATADTVNLVSGRVAAVLGLARAHRGQIDHYGRGPGASSLIPEFEPSG